MKRIIIISVVFLLGIICCKENKKEDPVEVDLTSETVEIEGHYESTQEPEDTWVNDIVLNNGIKWQANAETTDGVKAMLSLINENEAYTVDNYMELGNNLNDVKNTVVKECTMKGPSHDNLHVWLYPLIKKIELLQKTEIAKEGEEITSNIKNHLEGYYDYFI